MPISGLLNTILQGKEAGLLEEQSESRSGEKKCKMILEHRFRAKNQEVLKARQGYMPKYEAASTAKSGKLKYQNNDSDGLSLIEYNRKL